MITRDIDAFIAVARTLKPDFGPATARAAFLVSPDGFVRAEQSAQDNRYMADPGAFDADAALREHHALQLFHQGRILVDRPHSLVPPVLPFRLHDRCGHHQRNELRERAAQRFDPLLPVGRKNRRVELAFRHDQRDDRADDRRRKRGARRNQADQNRIHD